MAKALIINADDLGYDPEVTRGILEAMDTGVVSSATLMINGPHSADAAGKARGRAVGLHLNLARWRPLSQAFPVSLLERGEFSEPLAAQLPADAVEQEALAQLSELERMLGAPATHMDVHKHLHRHSNVLSGLLSAAARSGLPVRAIDAEMRGRIRAARRPTTDAFIGDAGAEPYWTSARFDEALASCREGLTELMCHPGYAPSAVKSGYAAQRETELRTFTATDGRQRLTRAGVSLVDFRVLAR